MRSLEVLYDARVVDERTPISLDGQGFTTLADEIEVHARVVQVKQMLVNGQDPWIEDQAQAAAPAPTPAASRPAPSAASRPAPSASRPAARRPPPTRPPPSSAPPPAEGTDDLPTAPFIGAVPYEDQSPVRAMFECARARANGELTLTTPTGSISLMYRKGKIVGVQTDIPDQTIGAFLVARRICDQVAIQQATQQAPSMGGDLGSALISLGLVPPHTYVEKFVEWARSLIGVGAGAKGGTAEFEQRDVGSPAVPLGLDRMRVLIEAVRALSESAIESHLAERRGLLLIPSQAEGVRVDDLKLDPRELRAFRFIDGAKSCDEVLTSVQGRGAPGLRAVYLATELQMVVFGDDPDTPKEREEAKKLQDILRKMQKKNYYEVLDVAAGKADDDVRSAYMRMAKLYHPDRVRTTAAPELLDVRKNIFALVLEAFENLETADKRKSYDGLLAAGVTNKEGEQLLVQAILEAENLFRKAESLVRSRKYPEAVEAISEAIHLKPDDVEFKIHKVYFEFLTKKRDRELAAENAARDIRGLLKDDEKIASGYLFLGRLYKVVDDVDKAIRNFKKVLEYDPKNTEATSELRLANMRKSKKKKKWL